MEIMLGFLESSGSGVGFVYLIVPRTLACFGLIKPSDLILA